jgi:GNAT superfamily N-acetyltransferase
MIVSPTIIAAESRYAERIFGVLTVAFAADPAARWLFPEAEQFLRHFPAFARALGGAALTHGTAFTTRDYAAVTLWLAPDVGPDEEALDNLIEENVAPEKKADMAAVIEQMVRYHPTEPHWYLPFIGVEPGRQNNGLGAALLQAQLATCDAAGLPAYLESSNPKNQALYERHGFEAIAQIKVGECPPIVPMFRRPRRE